MSEKIKLNTKNIRSKPRGGMIEGAEILEVLWGEKKEINTKTIDLKTHYQSLH